MNYRIRILLCSLVAVSFLAMPLVGAEHLSPRYLMKHPSGSQPSMKTAEKSSLIARVPDRRVAERRKPRPKPAL